MGGLWLATRQADPHPEWGIHTKHDDRTKHDGGVIVADDHSNDDRAAAARGGPEEQFGAPIGAPNSAPSQKESGHRTDEESTTTTKGGHPKYPGDVPQRSAKQQTQTREKEKWEFR